VPRAAAVVSFVSQKQRALDEEFFDEVLRDFSKAKS
jgi:hypothetical protein